MKKHALLLLLAVFTTTLLHAQKTNFNEKKGYVASGYDVVSYFSNQTKVGNNKFKTIYEGAHFRFSNEENLNIFKANPEKYAPQYGGYCSYAMATNGDKVKIDPETYEIRDGKLFLFYNFYFTNTKDDWLKEGPAQLQKKADKNWQKIISKS